MQAPGPELGRMPQTPEDDLARRQCVLKAIVGRCITTIATTTITTTTTGDRTPDLQPKQLPAQRLEPPHTGKPLGPVPAEDRLRRQDSRVDDPPMHDAQRREVELDRLPDEDRIGIDVLEKRGAGGVRPPQGLAARRGAAHRGARDGGDGGAPVDDAAAGLDQRSHQDFSREQVDGAERDRLAFVPGHCAGHFAVEDYGCCCCLSSLRRRGRCWDEG